MKLSKKYLPIIGLSLMLFMTAGGAFVLAQAENNFIFLLLALVTLPLFFAIIYVLLQLKKEKD